jgi:hypothetical protein
MHLDNLRELEASSGAVIALANYAPRDEASTQDGNNGSEFHLAITDSGLEVYVTPLRLLSGLARRNRIVGLYRIPNENHPEFDGDNEQFRSARVVRTRRHPEHLLPVFQYRDQEELVAAIRAGTYPEDCIPTDKREGHIAYVDRFGNVRLELRDRSKLLRLGIGRTAALSVINNGEEYEVEVQLADNLHSAPLNRLTVYANCSDQADPTSPAGYAELIARVDGNPNRSTRTAIFQLLKRIPDLDPATAEVRLAA